MNNKKLLVVSDQYLAFVKDQLETMSGKFQIIDVLVKFHLYYMLNTNRLIDLSDIPHNVSILKLPIFHLPLNFKCKKLGNKEYKKLGNKFLKLALKAIKKNGIEFDIIHSHFIWPCGYVGAELKKRYEVPLIITAHGYDVYDLPFRDKEWKEKIEYVLNSADYIITVSNHNLSCLKQLDIKTPIEVIPNGFRGDLFYPMDSKRCREILNLPEDKKVILTAGNLLEVKGHRYLIEAIKELTKYREDIVCIIIGSGKLRKKLEKQVNSLNLNNYIKLVGWKSHSEIPVWMNACDLFVLPSLKESFGVVQVEAMACGKPVVATYNGGSEEIILSNTYGLLTEPKNPKNLSNKIMEALEMQWDSKAIEAHAKQFDWKNVTDKIMRIYDLVSG